jgi:hypothetical protein
MKYRIFAAKVKRKRYPEKPGRAFCVFQITFDRQREICYVLRTTNGHFAGVY